MATRTVQLISWRFLFLPLLLLGCGKPTQIIWRPSQQTMSQVASGSNLPYEPVDRALLAEMATSVLLETVPELIYSPLEPIGEDLPLHPQKGPFFFKNEAVFVAIAQDTASAWFFMEQLEEHLANKKIYFLKLPGEQADGILSISTQATLLDYRHQNVVRTSTLSLPEKIKLTPEKVAESLSQFSQWEGVHLDTQLSLLTFFGSDVMDNPQISVSDLVAAYKAIFVHEAAGEALFVDMDFGEGDNDYKVTFGGGFEDTRPGKVLLEADLLLKALSSGIDPWTDEKPLVQQMCNSTKKAPFQEVFCEIVNPFILKNRKKAKDALDASWEIYKTSSEEASLIVDFSMQADRTSKSAKSAWDYVFFANDYEKDIIKHEIEQKNYFSLPSLFGGRSGCACVPTFFWLNDCDKDCNGAATLKKVKEIFSLSNNQKSIVQEARMFEAENDRKLYATLAFISPAVHDFLRSQSRLNVSKVFSILEKLEEQLSDGNYESLYSSLAVLYFMSVDKDFVEAFLKLGDEDQLILAYVSARMMLDPGFGKMVNELQFHNPLCECLGCEIPEDINSMENAFVKFVCKHLRKFPRTYLAGLIRQEVHNDFDYLTAAEIRSYEEMPLGNGVHKTRYWFFPGNEVLVIDSSLNTFLFNRPNMEARAERLDTRRGPYEPIEYNTDVVPGVQENLNLINDNYDVLSRVFPTLKELNNLVKMLSFFRWIRDYHPYEFDLSAFSEVIDYGTPTLRKYPVRETVIVTPDGELLAFVGGVDLHSNTQVGLDQERIEAFLSAKNSSNGKQPFSFENKKFKASNELKAAGRSVAQSMQVFQSKQNRLEINQQDDLTTCHFSENGKLQWSLANLVHPLGNVMTVSTNYKDMQWYREFRDLKGAAGQWKIQRDASTLTASKLTAAPLTTDESVLRNKKVEAQLAEWLNMGLPFDATWQLLSMQFDTARLVWQNGAYLFSYWFNGQEKHMLAREESIGNWLVQSVDMEQASQFLDLPAPTVSAKNKNIHILGIRLLSTIPVDNLVVSEVGYKDDAPVQVHLFEKKPLKYDITEWMKLINSKGSQPFVSEKGSVFLFQPVVKEKKKGGYESFQLTNRPFLVETVANLNATHAGSGKRFGLLDTPASGELPINVEEVWKAPRSRKFFFDMEGFSEPCKQELKAIHASSPGNTIVLEQGQDMKIATSGISDSPEEMIWITGLSENEAVNRLELASSKGWFKNTYRLRLFNVNNPVYSLGKNLFIENENLSIIGAWQRIIDFETLKVLLKEMVLVKTPKELDSEVASQVASIKKEYKLELSPQKLRILRSFDDFSFFWEEARTNQPTGTSSWKVYEQNSAR